ncbi:PadR family transcriptional regulator [Edaphobacter bradus]|uniref:PadR family transcriptional regulator n=1 Tax=Edaphobacter bradus TaxID=2259016 RepID=UPI0021E038F3|nr:PadR family transcriptional regulator [Edaphobacter bradus]
MNDIIILSLLLEGPKHGYRLKQDAAMFTSQGQLHNNTVYPLLNRFLKSGWITQREADGERGQTRLLYELTAAGRQALTARLNEFSEADAANENAFRLRVGLFSEIEPVDRERILRLRDAYLAGRLERLEHIAGAHALTGWPARTFDYVASEVAEERKWIAGLMTKIQED